ncbi:MAG: flagella basal body P-ring formation protein FlgA [Gemmatimonadales bacterium]|nr:MAG: flagella basal body P-ring formation protein FlgA [Gemmatimonadales bacterium]
MLPSDFGDRRRGVFPMATLGLAGALLLGAAPAASAAVPSPALRAQDPPSPQVEQAVADEVSRRWDVPPEAVRLEWRPGRDALPSEPHGVTLVGSGAGGDWVVEVSGEGGLARRGLRAGVAGVRWTAARPLPRGHSLSEEDLRTEPVVRWGPPEVDREEPGPGWVTRRAMREGEEMRAPWVAPPVLVPLGSTVEVWVRRGRVVLRTEGEARSSGIWGEVVRVRLATGRVVMGRVVDSGRVEVIHGLQGGNDDEC